MDKIYVVVRERGVYDDHTENNQCAFLSEEKAEAYVIEKNNRNKLYEKAIELAQNNWHNFDKTFNYHQKYKEISNEYYSILNAKIDLKNQNKINKVEIQTAQSLKKLNKLKKIGHDERIRFINTFDFLSDEEKNIMISGRLNPDYNYSVETLELKD